MSNNDTQRLADLFANLIEKYGDKIDLESLAEPQRPAEKNAGLLLFKFFINDIISITSKMCPN